MDGRLPASRWRDERVDHALNERALARLTWCPPVPLESDTWTVASHFAEERKMKIRRGHLPRRGGHCRCGLDKC